MLSAGMPLLWRALLVTGWISSATGTDYCCIALTVIMTGVSSRARHRELVLLADLPRLPHSSSIGFTGTSRGW